MGRLEVLVGCCGYPVSRARYQRDFRAVELQETFYKVPQMKTVEKWRREAPEEFVFTLKAFQGVTHPDSSPTWKRSNVKPTKAHGHLKPTKQVMESWEVTLEICKKLSAEVCVVQTPPSFTDSNENLDNAREFFKRIKRDSVLIGFEPRGWKDSSILELCKEMKLIHVVDPFASKPLWTLGGKVAYLRLHGSPPGKKMYSYTYTDKDLATLVEFVKKLDVEKVYVMFNNVTMFNDGKRFKSLMKLPR